MKCSANNVTSWIHSGQFDVCLNVLESRAEHVRLSTLRFSAARISTDAALILHKLSLLEKKNCICLPAFMITSSAETEGKSLTAINMAVALAPTVEGKVLSHGSPRGILLAGRADSNISRESTAARTLIDLKLRGVRIESAIDSFSTTSTTPRTFR